MQIADNRVVTLAYTLKDNDDNLIDQSDDGSFCYLHGASNIIPGLESALTGKVSGDEAELRRLKKRIKELEAENSKLKRMYTDLSLENDALKDLISKKL